MATITLSNGEQKQAELPCYVLQAYFNGKWNNLEVHPCTEQGFKDAIGGYNRYDFKDMQVQTFR